MYIKSTGTNASFINVCICFILLNKYKVWNLTGRYLTLSLRVVGISKRRIGQSWTGFVEQLVECTCGQVDNSIKCCSFLLFLGKYSSSNYSCFFCFDCIFDNVETSGLQDVVSTFLDICSSFYLLCPVAESEASWLPAAESYTTDHLGSSNIH